MQHCFVDSVWFPDEDDPRPCISAISLVADGDIHPLADDVQDRPSARFFCHDHPGTPSLPGAGDHGWLGV